mmetsp:Transcript_125279/g.348578  ORF Transcript_125279/g.348578 Transcript_125279/m.348578 type:complete len:230 (+) Transcript_125279:610-1299(+)
MRPVQGYPKRHDTKHEHRHLHQVLSIGQLPQHSKEPAPEDVPYKRIDANGSPENDEDHNRHDSTVVEGHEHHLHVHKRKEQGIGQVPDAATVLEDAGCPLWVQHESARSGAGRTIRVGILQASEDKQARRGHPSEEDVEVSNAPVLQVEVHALALARHWQAPLDQTRYEGEGPESEQPQARCKQTAMAEKSRDGPQSEPVQHQRAQEPGRSVPSKGRVFHRLISADDDP